MSKFYCAEHVHRSWSYFFTPDILRLLERIEAQIGDDHTPGVEEVFRFAATDLLGVKLVILGQDPYAKAGEATGRCFEIAGLNDWSAKAVNSSLRNIVRNIYKAYTGETKKFADIRKEIDKGTFDILSPDKLFDAWEAQGVLMLYSFPTCRVDAPGSHMEIWRYFSRALVRYIYIRNREAAWFLWGREARALWEDAVPRVSPPGRAFQTYPCPHPGAVGGKANTETFVDCDCFEQARKDFSFDWLGTQAEKEVAEESTACEKNS